MIIKFLQHDSTDREPWWEEAEAPDGFPSDAAQAILDRFNATLRPGELARTLVRAAYIGPSRQRHDWLKASLVTERGGYDRMYCSKCNAIAKRYGMGETVRVTGKTDPKYCTVK